MPGMANAVKRASGRADRRERARATRLRMMRAAYELFCERGYAGTTMADVAERAGVAVQTVYFTFHTKRDLLSGSYDLAVMGEADPLPPDVQPWYLAAAAEPGLGEAIRLIVEGIGEIERRTTPLDTVVRAAAQADPDSAAVWQRHEQLRHDGFERMLVDVLLPKASLRDHLDAERATVLLLMLLGHGVYQALVLDYGWSHEAWADWVARAIEELFVEGT